METKATKDTLRELINKLPDNEVEAARRFLQFLIKEGDPPLIALEEAPVDEEELSDAAITAIMEGKADEAAGRVVSW